MFSFDFEENKSQRGSSSSSCMDGDFSEADDYSTDEEAFKSIMSTSGSAVPNAATSHTPSIPKGHETVIQIRDLDFVSTSSENLHQLDYRPLPDQLPHKQQSGTGTLSSLSQQAQSMNIIDNPPQKISKRDFELLRVIGKGAYGKVFLARKVTGIDNGTYYAMKVLKKATLIIHDKDAEHTRTERSILEDIRHPFIVRLFYAFQTDFKLYLILDYASGGELFMYLERQKMFLEDTALFYIAELVLALEHLHSNGIIYRDLKPENVLLDHLGHVKLADFGLSKVAIDELEKASTVCGTVEYMAPEVLANMPYDKVVDWWSLGALAYDMLTGSPPFTSNNRKKTMDLILNKKLSLPYFLSPDAKDLLIRLMRKSPIVRLGYDSAESIKKHRFFKSINWKSLLERDGMKPPIIPDIQAPDDVNNFHSTFTSMPVVDSPADVAPKDAFSGFSFVANSLMGPSNH